MRWPYKHKTIYDRLKRRFALIPRVVENEWVWLETYYSYTIEGYAGPETERFNTIQAAIDWVNSWEE
jgi:hypothetical protein